MSGVVDINQMIVKIDFIQMEWHALNASYFGIREEGGHLRANEGIIVGSDGIGSNGGGSGKDHRKQKKRADGAV